MKDYMNERIFDIIKYYFIVSDHEKAHVITDEIIKSYKEPHRKYHTLNHIAKCLDATNKFFNFDIIQINNMKTAIIYHDIVYNPFSNNKRNEKNSVVRFSFDIPGIISHHSGEIIRQMIMATTHDPKDIDRSSHALYSKSSYQEYICDIDLYQLGCGLNEFLINESYIREEYKMVSDEIFYPARYKILQSFLDRKFIYYNVLFQEKFENNARRNIKYVLDRQEIFSME